MMKNKKNISGSHREEDYMGDPVRDEILRLYDQDQYLSTEDKDSVIFSKLMRNRQEQDLDRNQSELEEYMNEYAQQSNSYVDIKEVINTRHNIMENYQNIYQRFKGEEQDNFDSMLDVRRQAQ